MRKQEFNSKLISLLPLDEVPVHVPLRRPRPLRFERLRVGGEGKADANLTNFLSTCCALAPQLAATPWGGSPPRPLCQKICYQTAQKTALCAPCEHPGGFGIRKSASNSGHGPPRGSGGCSMHCSMHCMMHYSMQCSTHCRPSLFAAHRP